MKIEYLFALGLILVPAALRAQHQDVLELSPTTTIHMTTAAKALQNPDAPLVHPQGVVFETNWQDATVDEKTAFLEASPEMREKIQAKWERASPAQRKNLLKKYSVGSRPLKHAWKDAAPEEKIAFLGTEPEVRQRIKETWEMLTQNQRLQLVRKRPAIIRKALHHSWTDATPEEKAAFMESQLDIRKNLEKAWSLAAGETSAYKSWEQAGPGERAQFLSSVSTALDMARARWDRLDPAARGYQIRKWAGWKLKPAPPPSPQESAPKAKK